MSLTFFLASIGICLVTNSTSKSIPQKSAVPLYREYRVISESYDLKTEYVVLFELMLCALKFNLEKNKLKLFTLGIAQKSGKTRL